MQKCVISLDGNDLNQVEKITTLGVVISHDARSEPHIKRRVHVDAGFS